jgi:hypothetical protein
MDCHLTITQQMRETKREKEEDVILQINKVSRENIRKKYKSKLFKEKRKRNVLVTIYSSRVYKIVSSYKACTEQPGPYHSSDTDGTLRTRLQSTVEFEYPNLETEPLIC